MNIDRRKKYLVNTGRNSKCVYTPWLILEYNIRKDRINLWVEINNYAVSQRGESARVEYRLVEEHHE